MDCLRSFTIHASNTVSTSLPGIWVQNGNRYFNYEGTFTSQFSIQGYKNINIHGIEIVGNVDTQPGSSQKCNVLDWSTSIQLQGSSIPRLGGVINPSNPWNIDNSSALARVFKLGKYTNKVNFASPFESVKSIQFLNLNASGDGCEDATSVSLLWNLQWVFYYTFEGEQY